MIASADLVWGPGDPGGLGSRYHALLDHDFAPSGKSAALCSEPGCCGYEELCRSCGLLESVHAYGPDRPRSKSKKPISISGRH